ncbi:HAD family hydrolase, partial [Mangrovicoccus algicola]
IARPAPSGARAAAPAAGPGFLLACDIDGTLTGCARGAARFRDWLEQGDRIRGFAVATGRSVVEARRVLQDWQLPEPDTIIASTGTEIWRRGPRGYRLCEAYAALISADWDPEALAPFLEGDGLSRQPDYEQRRWKTGLFGSPAAARRVADALARAGRPARVVPSHGRFVDILPARAGKAAAIRFEAARRGLPDSACLVAGDSGNDADMIAAFARAVIPANALPELDALRCGYRSPMPHAAGVLDGIAHFRLDDSHRRERAHA